MGEKMELRSYTSLCSVCGEEVSLFEVFPPEVYCSLHTPANGLPALVIGLIKTIEVEADVVVWLACREFGGSTNAESLRARSLAARPSIALAPLISLPTSMAARQFLKWSATLATKVPNAACA